MKKKIIIMGAAGRDFHDFNTNFRDNEAYDVIAFTATQIPDIEGRKYPAVLAGKLYPNGIPIVSEEELPRLIKKHDADEVTFSYSDVSFSYLMDRASLVLSCGADFRLLSKHVMLKSIKPVISICATRTGCGKSQTTRRVAALLKKYGKRVAVVRHPMPYGDLAKQACQKYETLEDMKKHKCTIEEMEEYEPHIVSGNILFAGVDYEMILREAEKVADVILWDGGNNDVPFFKPDLHIVVTDPHRPGTEVSYHPGETNLRMADVIIINKIDTARPEGVTEVRKNIRKYNPRALIVMAASPLFYEGNLEGKKALVVEDGPTVTHGDMPYGAGFVAAQNAGAIIIDPHPYAVGTIKKTYEKYTKVPNILPAMGYSDKQIKDLEKTINSSDAEVVVIGTPIDLTRIIRIKKPFVRVRYELQEIGKPDLVDVVERFVKRFLGA
jgi:predicted GTPase